MAPGPRLYKLLLVLLLMCSQVGHAATFTVTTNADSGPGSLREAIQNAAGNGTGTPDIIVFNIPYTDINSVTIPLESALPDLTSNLTIDASTQSSAPLGVSGSRVILQPKGGNNYITMLDACMVIRDADNVQLYGLCFKLFSEFSLAGTLHQAIAIHLFNANNVVFGAPGKGNVITGCSYGLFKAYSMGTVNNIKVQSNFFGCDVDGVTKLLRGYSWTNINGIELTLSSNALIGGSTEQEGNIFSDLDGVAFIEMKGYCEIGNNKFSTDYTGNTSMGNGGFGGRDSPADFYIHDNVVAGEVEFNSMSGRFLVTHNFWGTNSSGTAKFENGILDFNNCTGAALIGGNDASVMNVFANGVLGVGNNNSKKITVLHNSFYCHDDDGIYMNWYNLPNKPFITINKVTATSVEGTARPNSIIEIYETDNCRHCEGKTFTTRLNADGAGNWKYSGVIAGTVTATATNIDDSTTSAFAQSSMDVSGAVVTNASCDKSNGKITGIKITSGTNFSWTDINGNVVGTDTNLLNVPGGQYQLWVGIGNNTCRTVTQVFNVGNTKPPKIDGQAFQIKQPACGAPNGLIVYQQFHLPATTLWMDGNGNPIQTGGDSLKNLRPGTYFLNLVLPTDNTCISISPPVVLVNQSGPSVNTASATITPATCNKPIGSITGVSINNISGSAVYRWYDANNKQVGAGVDLINVSPGLYHLAFKDGGSCDTIITAPLRVPSTGSISFDVSSIQFLASKCGSVTGGISGIKVTNGYSYLWKDTVTGRFVSAENDLQNAQPGYYKLIATSAEGCIDSTITYHITQAVAELFQSTVKIIPEHCGKRDGSVVVTPLSSSQSGFTFKWVNDNDPATSLSTALSLQNISAGHYTCYGTDRNGCSSVVTTVAIVNQPAPVINNHTAVVTADICNQQNGSVSQLSISGGNPLAYQWYSVAGQPIAQSKDLTGVGHGDYYLVVNDAGNCADTSQVFTIATATENVAVPIFKDVVVLKGDQANLSVKNYEAGNYELYTSSSAATPSEINQTGKFVTGPISIDTAVYIILRKGDCVSPPAKINIKVAINVDVTMPNAFSPNNDGTNDVFRIKYPAFIKAINFTVFNRWGQKVFHTTDPSIGWDGTMNGQPQPTGGYIWMIDYTNLLGASKKISGYVVLVR